MSLLRIAVLGAAGKMGRAIVRAIGETARARRAVAVERAGSPDLGADAAALAGLPAAGVPVQATLPRDGEADVWIDFSAPAAAIAHARAAATGGAALVL